MITRRKVLERAGILVLLAALLAALYYPVTKGVHFLSDFINSPPTEKKVQGTPSEGVAFSPMRYSQSIPTPPGENILGVQMVQSPGKELIQKSEDGLPQVQPSESIISLQPLDSSWIGILNQIHSFTGLIDPALIRDAGRIHSDALVILNQDPMKGVDKEITDRLGEYQSKKAARDQIIVDLHGAKSLQPEVLRVELLKIARDIDLLLLRRSLYKIPAKKPINVVPGEGLLGNPDSDVPSGSSALPLAQHLQKDEAELNLIIAPNDVADIMQLWKSGNSEASIVLARPADQEANTLSAWFGKAAEVSDHVPTIRIADILDILDPDELPSDQVLSKIETNDVLPQAAYRSRSFRLRVRWRENYPPDQVGALTYKGFSANHEERKFADNHLYVASAELAGGPAELPYRWDIALYQKQIEHIEAESRDLANLAAHIRELANLAQANRTV